MHTNQKLLVDLLLKNGATYKVLDEYEELLEISYQNKKDYLLDRFSSVISFPIVKMTADKFFTKKILLENNIKTPEGLVFNYSKISESLIFAKNNYPVVIKPVFGSHGDSVYVNISNDHDFLKCINDFFNNNSEYTPFIVEKFFKGNEFRVFITENKDFAVIQRDFAHVYGDGINTIEKLISIENNKRIILKKSQNTSLCPIVIDNEVLRFLKEQNLTLNSIIDNNLKIYLRGESNLVKGGVSVDKTQNIHPFYIDLAFKTLKCFPNLKFAGLDLLTQDISIVDDYSILEINSNPGFSMHYLPAIGNPVPVAEFVLPILFPNWFVK